MVSSTSYIEKSRYVLISEFALSLSEATGLDALKTDVIPKLKYIIDFNSCTLALLNEDESSYRLLNLLETRQEMSRTATERLPLDSGIHGNVILNGEPHIYSDHSWEPAETMEVVDPSLAGSSLNSIMCLSLQVGGKVFGSIAFGTNQNVGYTHADINIASTIATHLSLAIDRWHMIEKLSTAEERYRFLYNLTPVMMHSTDPNGKLVSVNRHWLKTLGYEYEEVIGKRVFDFYTEASAQYASEVAFKRFLETRYLKNEEIQVVKKHGEIIDCLLSAHGRWNEQGKLINTTAFLVDVTERKRAEDAIRKARDELEVRVKEKTAELSKANEVLNRYTKRLETLQEIDRAILAARSPQTIAQAALGQIRELVSCERASVAVFDFESGGGRIIAVDSQSESHLSPGSRFLLDAFWKIDALREGAVHSVEDATQLPDEPYGRMLRNEGMRSWINVPLIAQDELIGSLNLGSDRVNAFSSDDIDAVREVANSLAIAIHQAHLHDQVQRQAAELEQRVTERTAELEAFSYSVSHDLRAPLRSIDGFSRVLLEDYSDKLDPECNRLLNVICANASNMGQLIDDLLAFSRLGRQEMKLTDIDMGELTRGVSNELVSDRRVEVRIGTLPPARGDPAMIRQVLVNLLSNGIKFTQPKDTSRIEIGHRNGNNENTYYVKDNGVGFDMRYVEKIFGVFQRLHGTDEFEGTGVGLAIVQSIIQRHGGRVWAEGKINQGTTIYFTLPPGANKE